MHSSTSVSVSWPADDAEDGDDRHGDEREQAEHLGHAVELALQRRLGPLGRGDHVRRCWPICGRAAGGGHHERRRAPGDLGVLEHQVGPVAQRDLALGQRAPRPWPSARSPRSARPPAPPAWPRTTIRPSAGTTSPASSSTMSPGTSLVESISLDLPGAPHPGMRHLQLGQRLHAGPGLQLLVRAHHHVERHQPQHHHGRSRPGRSRSWPTTDDQQHDVHRVRPAGPAHHPHARRRLGRQLVRPVLRQPPLHLVGVQPVIRIDTHLRRPRPPATGRTRRGPRRAAARWSSELLGTVAAYPRRSGWPSARAGHFSSCWRGSVSIRSPGRRSAPRCPPAWRSRRARGSEW